MSLVTPRKSLIQAAGTTLLNVEDFENIGVYLSGTVTITSITRGTRLFDGTFLAGTAITTPTAGAPTVVDVQGFDVVRVILAGAVMGDNGVFIMGKINKVSNE